MGGTTLRRISPHRTAPHFSHTPANPPFSAGAAPRHKSLLHATLHHPARRCALSPTQSALHPRRAPILPYHSHAHTHARTPASSSIPALTHSLSPPSNVFLFFQTHHHLCYRSAQSNYIVSKDLNNTLLATLVARLAYHLVQTHRVVRSASHQKHRASPTDTAIHSDSSAPSPADSQTPTVHDKPGHVSWPTRPLQLIALHLDISIKWRPYFLLI